MATRAFAAGLEAQPAVRNLRLIMESCMTLQAELPPFAAHQKQAVGAAVRIVAGDATFYFHCGMFKDKRPALFHMAIHTGLRTWIVQAGEILRAVRVVAVRTLHQSFRNAMVIGQRKLCLHGQMAGVAKRGLGLLQQAVVQPTRLVSNLRQLKEIRLWIAQIPFALVPHLVHQMRRVALIAGNAVASVFRMFKKFLLFAGGVAGQAARRILRSGASKREERKILQRFRSRCVVAMCSLYRIGVCLGRTVARLAAMNVLLGRKSQRRMAGLAILNGNFFVAIPAPLRSRERTLGRIKLRRTARDRRSLCSLRSFLRQASHRDES